MRFATSPNDHRRSSYDLQARPSAGLRVAEAIIPDLCGLFTMIIIARESARLTITSQI